MNLKKKEMESGAIFLISLLFMGFIFVTGAGTSQDDYSVEDFYVDENTAWKLAVAYSIEFVTDDTPGLENWDGAEVQKDPVTVYDIHGKKLFYEFAVTKNGKCIGEMEMAASKVFGCLLNRIITAEPLDRDNMKQEAIEIAKKEYPGCQLRYTKPVCYSYPKEGVMLILVKPEAKEEKSVIIDTFTSSVVPLKQPIREGDFGVWSLYDKIPFGKRAKMVENWNKNARNIATERPTASDKKLNVKLYPQEESNWCGAAVGQMIAEYYGVNHSQTFVAECMDLEPGSGGGASNDNQLVYYYDNLSKDGSYKCNASFDGEKGEIEADRPLKSGIKGHARCAIGYIDGALDYIYINDPWPKDRGLEYWEWWGFRTHTTDIHVMD